MRWHDPWGTSMIGRIKRSLIIAASTVTRKLNGQYAQAILVKSGDMKFLVSPDDMVVGRYLRRFGKYGDDELSLLTSLITNNSCCLLVGTHVGAIALPISKIVKEACLVEANPHTFQLLQLNLLINNIDNCDVFNFAAGEANGEIRFVLSKVNSGGAKREPIVKEKMYYCDNPDTISVPLKILDDVFLNRTFDLILMDIEGSEYFALKGMKRLLNGAQYLVMEFIPHHLDNVSGVTVEELVSLINDFFDYLFVPSLQVNARKEEFVGVLTRMYDAGLSDAGIVFSKQKLEM